LLPVQELLPMRLLFGATGLLPALAQEFVAVQELFPILAPFS
jgi:hypothetical protein